MNDEDDEFSQSVLQSPFFSFIVIVTGAMYKLGRWIFKPSWLSSFIFFFACVFAGMIVWGTANSAMAKDNPESAAAFIRHYWIMLYGPSETVGFGVRLIVWTGVLAVLPLWIVFRLAILPFYLFAAWVWPAFKKHEAAKLATRD